MSYKEICEIKSLLKNLTERVDEATNILNNLVERVAYLENTRIVAIENEQVVAYKKITEDMHDSLVAISRASSDAMRATLLTEMNACAAQMIAKHQTAMHPTFRPPPKFQFSGSATNGSS